MGLRSLHEELEGVLGEARGSTGSPCRGCGSLSEALRYLAEGSGLTPDALEEAMKCNPECRGRYVSKDGRFKDGPDTCAKMFSECCKGVKNPEALCAYIGRRARA